MAKKKNRRGEIEWKEFLKKFEKVMKDNLEAREKAKKILNF